MEEVREKIVNVLKNDSTLLNMLPVNSCWFDKKQRDKKWSILPADVLTEQNSGQWNKPLVTYQSGIENRTDYHLLEDFFYVRCYNANDKAYVSIDEVLSRVKVLLHRQPLQLANSVGIELVYETTSQELLDEAYNLKYRESRFRLLRI